MSEESPRGPVERIVGRRRAGPRRYIVDSPRNSLCAVPLRSLDWNKWFTDGERGALYLHLYRAEDDTWHRVRCRHSDAPRLSCDGGLLRWLVDSPPNAYSAPGRCVVRVGYRISGGT